MKADTEHVKNILKKYSHLDITNPEQFATLKTLTIDRDIRLLVKIATSGLRPLDDSPHKLPFIYTHYHFIQNHLKALICKYEGHGASTDKTRLLIQHYLDFLQTEETPVFKERIWNIPLIGKGEEWMKWIDSMCELFYGNEEPYIKTKHTLSQQYEEWMKKNSSIFDGVYRNSDYFIEMTSEDGKKVYHFANEQTQEKGSIYFETPMNISFLFKDKPIPDWFENLLNIEYK